MQMRGGGKRPVASIDTGSHSRTSGIAGREESERRPMSDPRSAVGTGESGRFLRNLLNKRVQLTTVQRSLATNGTLRQVYEDSLVLELDEGQEVLVFLHALISITAVAEGYMPAL